MKTILPALVLYLLSQSLILAADGNPQHEHKTIPGPNGGRVIEVEGGHAEFLIRQDRKISLTFYSDDLKPQVPGDQVITVIAQTPSEQVKLDFDKSADGFVSKSPLPAGEGYQLVLQIRAKADAKPVNTRIKLDLAKCEGCKRSEYACICEGHGQ
ncbi:MAG: hypothetical protein SFU85_11510 [Candidatus Methylacidiphilales bacterium]|nr:hypothetical protein [Candidatus Methylacidiphilales bacterium]